MKKKKTFINETQLRRIIRQELLREMSHDVNDAARPKSNFSVEDVIQYYEANPDEWWAEDAIKWEHCHNPRWSKREEHHAELLDKWGSIVNDPHACRRVFDTFDARRPVGNPEASNRRPMSSSQRDAMWRSGPSVRGPSSIERGLSGSRYDAWRRRGE